MWLRLAAADTAAALLAWGDQKRHCRWATGDASCNFSETATALPILFSAVAVRFGMAKGECETM